MKTTRTITKLALLLALLALAAGCGGGRGDDDDEASGTTTSASGGGDLSGRIAADGSSTVGPYTTAAAERFQNEQSAVQITVGVSGTGGGFERFCRGETDLSNASRPIKDEEASICEDNGVEYVEFQVANDALTVVVNPENDWATCLTVEQLNKIWAPGSKVDNWNQVDASFPDQALKLFGAGTDSGTFDYFTDEINGEEGASRSDYSATEDDNVTVQGVSGDKGGARLLRLLLLRGESGQAEGDRDRRRRRLRRPQRRDRPERHLQAAGASALRLREERVVRAAGGCGLRQVHDRQRDRDRRGLAVRAAHRGAARRRVGRVRGRGRGRRFLE